MTAVDYGIVGLVLISVLIGVWRGFVRETLGLGTWVLALVLAWAFARPVSDWLAAWIEAPSIRLAVAGGALFLIGLLIGGILTSMFAGAIRNSWLAGADRTLGAGLGLIRGLVLLIAAVWLLRSTPAAQDPWWVQSRLIPPLETLAQEADRLLPAAWRDPLAAETAAVSFSS